MIVIHPKDQTTSFLKEIYQQRKDVSKIIDETWPSRSIREAIGTAPKNEIIMMLGHGYSGGMYAPYGGEQFAREIINGELVYLLREHPCIGIWCYANKFAERYNLNGLFSGMIISEIDEAYNLGIYPEAEEDIDKLNARLAKDIDYSLRHYSLDLVPETMRNLQDYHSDLTDFNYNNFFFIKNKIEQAI